MRLALAVLFAGIALAQTPMPSPFLGSGGGGGGSVPASSVTAGTFGAGNYVFPGNLSLGTVVTLGSDGSGRFTPTVISAASDPYPTAFVVDVNDFDNPRTAVVNVITGFNSIVDYYGSGVISQFIYGTNSKVYNETSNSPSAEIYGGFYLGDQYDTGTVSKVYGIFSRGSNEGGTAGSIYGGYFATTQTGLATTNAYGVYVDTPTGTTATNDYAFYAKEQAGSGTNAYAFWADEQGVYRIRADNTFDSVYQAIPALYNPLFTKYAPGAVNYERIVEQWNGNVAEIGAEKGGTGTLRNLKLLGANYLLPSLAAGAATGKQVVCFDPATGRLYGSSTGTDCSN